jgi:hypothetical protein
MDKSILLQVKPNSFKYIISREFVVFKIEESLITIYPSGCSIK